MRLKADRCPRRKGFWRIHWQSASGRHILLVSVCEKIRGKLPSAFPALSDLFQLETISRRWSTLLLGHSATVLPLLYHYSIPTLAESLPLTISLAVCQQATRGLQEVLAIFHLLFYLFQAFYMKISSVQSDSRKKRPIIDTDFRQKIKKTILVK